MATLEEVESLKRDLESAKLARELQETQYAVRAMQSTNNLVEGALPELVDDSLYDDPDFLPLSGRGQYYQVGVDDRSDGKFLPVYESEWDLSRIRAQCIRTALLSPISVGALDSLKDYTLGPNGLRYLAQPVEKAEPPEGLIEAIQELIEHILHVNQWSGVLDREYHDRARYDGEVISVIDWVKGDAVWREEEPEHLTEPMSARDLEDRFGSGNVDSWTFGVHTVKNRPDVPLGYHFVRDPEGRDWEYIPADRVCHYKRNVTRRAKRGISDFWPILKHLETNDKLTRNMGEGGALQAAIAWIRELPQGSSASSASGRVVSEASYSRKIKTNAGSDTRYGRHFPPGSIITVTPGGTYKPGPMGSERNAGFIEVSQHLMRAIGVRWSLPEYLVSGDTSNGNYSSTSIAADSFVRARLTDQRSIGMADADRLWKSLRMYFKKGKLDAFDLSWEEIRSTVKITPKGDDPSTKDPLGKREALAIEAQNGWVSDETAAQELGRDYQAEVAKGAERKASPNVAATNGEEDDEENADAAGKDPKQTGKVGGKKSKPPMREGLHRMFEHYGEVWT